MNVAVLPVCGVLPVCVCDRLAQSPLFLRQLFTLFNARSGELEVVNFGRGDSTLEPPSQAIFCSCLLSVPDAAFFFHL